MKIKKSVSKTLKASLCLMLCGTLASGAALTQFASFHRTPDEAAASQEPVIKKINDVKGLDLKEYLSESTVQKITDRVEESQVLSVIVSAKSDPVIDAYGKRSKADASATVSEFKQSAAGERVSAKIRQEIGMLKNRVRTGGFTYTFGAEYNVLLSGFEVLIQAKDYEKLAKLMGNDASLTIGDEYERCETQVVENIVDIDEETGIFNSKESEYDGSGTVIAVLDTGLDYTHSAFDASRFEGEDVLTVEKVAEKIGGTKAYAASSGLTASDVRVNKKVPFAYDYADKDPDVFPIDSDHGTHVSGIIVGNDDRIRGVAPNAQLVSMKVFSDQEQGARSSWILSALEDAVELGVDVINLSLGSSCGFTDPQDKADVQRVYAKVGTAGISLVTAASNDFSSYMGSAKNGNLGLTSNPDSATVGSPSTYTSSLSVASVSGVKTPYLKYNDTIIYFNEASNQASEPKDFVGELLGDGETNKTLEYVTIPGVGRSADYAGIDVEGKIALVKRGSTTFEDKVRVANRQKAAGIIVYNNVSGTISMTVGKVDLPACSVSQTDGELLASKASGTFTISTSQVAGPFMSEFSSWGPTPDLKIKPEITAHGGDILSSVPGQRYDRMSGTSMASPNQAGVTALVRQYVKETFTDLTTPNEITARVNQLMMSTADIMYNTNGLAFAVRKQGAGLSNLAKATSTPAYISTYETVTDKDGNSTVKEMDKSKLELGDDPDKKGVYEMSFTVNNVSQNSLTYQVGAIVMTEGVSETLTVRGDTTVTEQGYALGAKVELIAGGNGDTVTVAAGNSANLKVRVTLTDADKEYLNKSFENGMYIEGFVTLTANGEEDPALNVPYLAFYGDWNMAPIFDLDYFETDPDAVNNAIDPDQKTMADTVATTPIGALYDDYITYLGGYMFAQDPSAVQIAADRNHVSLTNQTGSSGGVNGISQVWAGLLRGAEHIDISVTDSVTGEVIFTNLVRNQYKSFNSGGSIVSSTIKVDFNLDDFDLKNNTRYDVKLTAFTDYGDGGINVNKRNTFEFSFTTDFEAPVVTGCDFYTEYDSTAKKTKLFANISVYDNHYAQGAGIGAIVQDGDDENSLTMDSFNRYITPLYSDFNSTYTFTYELTDYIERVKNSRNPNSFAIEVVDYAMNTGIYEIRIPDTVSSIESFLDTAGNEIDTLTLSPYEVYNVDLKIVSPDGNTWKETVSYESSNEAVAGVVNGKIIARGSGTAEITAIASDGKSKKTLTVNVLKETDAGYIKYDQPVTDSFKLIEYYVDKAFYFQSSDDRALGETGDTVKFSSSSYGLSFYPSEAVTLKHELLAYFPDDITIEYSSGNENVAKVEKVTDQSGALIGGKITAIAEGITSISVRVLLNGQSTVYSQSVSVNVKNSFSTNSMYFMHYYGVGETIDGEEGVVKIPEDLGVTEIYQYAFANYSYQPKDENDEISDEDPYHSKPMPIGENSIKKVIIPEGVETIDSYAFAFCTALEEVVLPKTLKKIQNSAFYGCTKLKKINLENVQFININAFYNCPIRELDLSSVVALGNGAFEFADSVTDADQNQVHSALRRLLLPVTAQSLGSRAFYGNTALAEIRFQAETVKLGDEVFRNCTSLASVTVNASVIPASAFEGCSNLNSVTLGKDVSVIGNYAFAGTRIEKFNVAEGNGVFKASSDKASLLNASGDTLILAAPNVGRLNLTTEEIGKLTTIGDGAFAGNTKLTKIELPNVTAVGNYAFGECTNLSGVTLGNLKEIGEGAFYQCTLLTKLPAVGEDLTVIGSGAFMASGLAGKITIPRGVTVGSSAFANCNAITEVELGDGVTVNNGAFYTTVYSESTQAEGGKWGNGTLQLGDQTLYLMYANPYSDGTIASVTAGDGVTIGANAFAGQMQLKTLDLKGSAVIGDSAFYLDFALENANLGKVTKIGDSAFAGTMVPVQACERSYYGFTPVGTVGYLSLSMSLKNVDLSAVTELSAYAFSVNESLETVTLGSGLKTIGAYAFAYDKSLKTIDLGAVEHVGEAALLGALSLESADLGSVKTVGRIAFAYIGNVVEENVETALKSVTLAPSAMIGEQAFAGNKNLAAADLGKVIYIGEKAFKDTALKSADLTSVEYLGDFAFENSKIESVKLGGALEKIGENPFAGCALADFAKDGKTTFEVGEVAFVEDGVLYAYAPNGGLVLVSYPMLKEQSGYAVKAGTVRISAQAFAGNKNLVNAELPYELKAIGDKAFFGCEKLTVVAFNSVAAPILEEAYDAEYQEPANLPLTGIVPSVDGEEHNGLAVIPYYMWTYSETNYFYGANFINYIGKQDQALIFVTPSNGTGYDSFVMSQYYTERINGAVAPYEATLNAIAKIAAIPANVSLTDEAAVIAAREAYDAIASLEQQALVTNYEKLTAAENIITYLKGNTNVEPEPELPVSDKNGNVALVITFAVLTGVFAVAAIAFAALWILGKRKTAKAGEPEEKSNFSDRNEEDHDDLSE